MNEHEIDDWASRYVAAQGRGDVDGMQKIWERAWGQADLLERLEELDTMKAAELAEKYASDARAPRWAGVSLAETARKIRNSNPGLSSKSDQDIARAVRKEMGLPKIVRVPPDGDPRPPGRLGTSAQPTRIRVHTSVEPQLLARVAAARVSETVEADGIAWSVEENEDHSFRIDVSIEDTSLVGRTLSIRWGNWEKTATLEDVPGGVAATFTLTAEERGAMPAVAELEIEISNAGDTTGGAEKE